MDNTRVRYLYVNNEKSPSRPQSSLWIMKRKVTLTVGLPYRRRLGMYFLINEKTSYCCNKQRCFFFLFVGHPLMDEFSKCEARLMPRYTETTCFPVVGAKGRRMELHGRGRDSPWPSIACMACMMWMLQKIAVRVGIGWTTCYMS